jgi:hypothetical protein
MKTWMINWFRGYYRLTMAGITLGLGGSFANCPYAFPGPLTIRVIPLDMIQPTSEKDMAKLSAAVREQITAVLQREGSFLMTQ